MSAGLRPANSLNHFNCDSGIPLDSIRSADALVVVATCGVDLISAVDAFSFIAPGKRMRLIDVSISCA